MTTTATSTGEITVRLPADCRLAAVEPLASRLADALAARSVALDGGEVARIDTAGLQLLLVFQREATQRAVPWRWLDVSEVMDEAAATLGLTQALDIRPPAAAPA